MELKTKRLRLRRLVNSDANTILQLFSDPEVIHFTGIPDMKDISDAQKFIQQTIDGFETGNLLEWGVEERLTGRLIGICAYFKWEEEHKRAEIGFALGKDYWGQGLMGELLNSFIPFGFSELNLHRMEADVDPRNVASIKLLKNFGFRKEGHLRERYHQHGEIQDALIFGLLRDELIL